VVCVVVVLLIGMGAGIAGVTVVCSLEVVVVCGGSPQAASRARLEITAPLIMNFLMLNSLA
jgi:hypothetical protein